MTKRPIRFLALATMTLLISACNGDSSTQVSLNNGGSGGIFGSSAASTAELTPDQGRKLLLEIRKNPDKMNKLTPPERRFLAKSTVKDSSSADR